MIPELELAPLVFRLILSTPLQKHVLARSEQLILALLAKLTSHAKLVRTRTSIILASCAAQDARLVLIKLGRAQLVFLVTLKIQLILRSVMLQVARVLTLWVQLKHLLQLSVLQHVTALLESFHHSMQVLRKLIGAQKELCGQFKIKVIVGLAGRLARLATLSLHKL